MVEEEEEVPSPPQRRLPDIVFRVVVNPYPNLHLLPSRPRVPFRPPVRRLRLTPELQADIDRITARNQALVALRISPDVNLCFFERQ